MGTALITGASSGIGAAFARHLAARKYNLILTARRAERLETLAAELRAQHAITAETLVADLSRADGVARVEDGISTALDLRLVVNNAGVGGGKGFARAEMGPQLEMIHVHVIASVRLTRAALPAMIAAGRGSIINVASLMAFMPLPREATYCATKAYLVAFSRALQLELRGTGVRVQALCPGMTRTELHDRETLARLDRLAITRLFWSSADEVVEASLKALARGQVVCVPGLRNRVILALARMGAIETAIRIVNYG